MITFIEYLEENMGGWHHNKGANVTAGIKKPKKWKVSYDVYGNNREKPLYSNHKHVYADSEDEAKHNVQSLVGGSNHKAELVEEVLDEISIVSKQAYKDKATPDIIKKILKGDKHRAVKRANAVSKLDKQLKEASWTTPDKQPAKDLQKGESVYVKHPDNGYQMVTGRYQRTETNPSGKAKPGHPHGHLIMLNKELPGRATKLYWAPHHEVFRNIEDGWPMSKPVKEDVELDEAAKTSKPANWGKDLPYNPTRTKALNKTSNTRQTTAKQEEDARMKKLWDERKARAAARQAEMDADIAKNPVTPEEQARADKLLAGALKTGKFYKDKMGA